MVVVVLSKLIINLEAAVALSPKPSCRRFNKSVRGGGRGVVQEREAKIKGDPKKVDRKRGKLATQSRLS